MTGLCVPATKTCEVLAWCPVENDHNIPEYVEHHSERKLIATCDACLCRNAVLLNGCDTFCKNIIRDCLCSSAHWIFNTTLSLLFIPIQPPSADVCRELHAVHQKLCDFPLVSGHKVMDLIHVKLHLAQQELLINEQIDVEVQ